jgi:hypothetical protein
MKKVRQCIMLPAPGIETAGDCGHCVRVTNTYEAVATSRSSRAVNSQMATESDSCGARMVLENTVQDGRLPLAAAWSVPPTTLDA